MRIRTRHRGSGPFARVPTALSRATCHVPIGSSALAGGSSAAPSHRENERRDTDYGNGDDLADSERNADLRAEPTEGHNDDRDWRQHEGECDVYVSEWRRSPTLLLGAD